MIKNTITNTIDIVLAIIFYGTIFMGFKGVYEFIKEDELRTLTGRRSNLLEFSRKLTGKKFDWEYDMMDTETQKRD